jgi:hypothetical protein
VQDLLVAFFFNSQCRGHVDLCPLIDGLLRHFYRQRALKQKIKSLELQEGWGNDLAGINSSKLTNTSR